MENDDYSSRLQIVEWFINNQSFITEITEPYRKQRADAITQSDPLFFDEIEKQYQEKVLSIVGIEICKQLGCSIELYYDVVGDHCEWIN